MIITKWISSFQLPAAITAALSDLLQSFRDSLRFSIELLNWAFMDNALLAADRLLGEVV